MNAANCHARLSGTKQWLENTRVVVTGQLVDAIGDFACLVFLFGGICETASCPVTRLVTYGKNSLTKKTSTVAIPAIGRCYPLVSHFDYTPS